MNKVSFVGLDYLLATVMILYLKIANCKEIVNNKNKRNNILTYLFTYRREVELARYLYYPVSSNAP